MSQKELFQIPAQLDKLTTRSDRTLKMEFGTTKEIAPDEVARIMKQHQKGGWLVFSPQDVEESDIPDIKLDVEMGETKSPSQRLRASLYRVWEANTSQKIAFEVWYRAKMEKIIEGVKENI